MKEEWVTPIRDLCLEQSVPFFFKQWGGVQKHRNGRILEGQVWDQMPESADQYSKSVSGSDSISLRSTPHSGHSQGPQSVAE